MSSYFEYTQRKQRTVLLEFDADFKISVTENLYQDPKVELARRSALEDAIKEFEALVSKASDDDSADSLASARGQIAILKTNLAQDERQALCDIICTRVRDWDLMLGKSKAPLKAEDLRTSVIATAFFREFMEKLNEAPLVPNTNTSP